MVLAKIDSTLENGRNGMDAGTKRSSDTAASNGSRDRVGSHLAGMIGVYIILYIYRYIYIALYSRITFECFSGLQRAGTVRQTEMVSPW